MEFAIFIALLIVLALIVMGLYNGLVGARNRAEEAWSQIDVQLKRRHDLIPNLVETAKGYMKHEREVFEQVARARQQAIQISGGADVQKRAQAENVLTGALRQLFAVAEAYPDLKANQNMLALQEELTSTENKISFARQHYNDSVLELNNRIQKMPTNLIASAFNFHERPFFELEEPSERQPVQVKF